MATKTQAEGIWRKGREAKDAEQDARLDALEAAGWDIFSGRPRPSRARLAREAALVLVR